MNTKKAMMLFLVIGFMTMLALPTIVLAGFEGHNDKPASEDIVGPTMWAVVVVECSSGSALMRVKSIDGCDVTTQALNKTSLEIDDNLPIGCDDDPTEYQYFKFDEGAVMEVPCQAVITKVKNHNFEDTNGFLSFDAQLRFIKSNDPGTQCIVP